MAGLTNWRAVLMLGGLPLHAVYGDESYPAFAAIILVSASFRMGTFFAIAGLLTGYALMRHGAAGWWLRQRLVRLGVPTLAGLAILSPIINLTIGAPDPVWPINPYHLWFLIGLIAYTLIAVVVHRLDAVFPVFDSVERRSREARRLQIAILLIVGLVSFTLMAIGRLIHADAPAALRPTTNHLPVILGYAPTFLLGFAAARAPTLRHMLTASHRVPVTMLVVALAAHLLLRASGPVLRPEQYYWWIDTLAVASAAWGPLAASILILRSAAAIRHVSPVLQRLADASFTIYLLHYPIIVATKTASAPLGWNPWVTFSLAMLTGGTLSYLVHRLVVVHVPVLRWLLAAGPSPERKPRQAAPEDTPAGLAIDHPTGGADEEITSAGRLTA